MLRRPAGCIVIAFLLSAPLVARQETPAAVFRSESDLVVLHVNVFDGRSDAVPDLMQHAFRVLENGSPQDVTFFAGADVPVTVGLILDNSSSMIARQSMLVAGGKAFARSSHPEDELFTVHFNEHVRFGLPPGLPFTNRQTLLQAALARFRPGGMTALYDAVIAGLDHLEFANHQKRVLVVLSDGDDNASRHSRREMMERARASDAIVYTIASGDSRQGLDANPRVLRELAEVSGGVALFPDDDSAVVEAFDTVAANVRRGYLLGYSPTNAAHDGSFRRVEVRVAVPGKRNLKVRSRDGYRAVSHADGR